MAKLISKSNIHEETGEYLGRTFYAVIVCLVSLSNHYVNSSAVVTRNCGNLKRCSFIGKKDVQTVWLSIVHVARVTNGNLAKPRWRVQLIEILLKITSHLLDWL